MPPRRVLVWRHFRAAEFVHVGNRAFDSRPDFSQQRFIARRAPNFGDEVNELAVAIVFRRWIGATAIDAAWYLAGLELIRRVPSQVLGSFLRSAKLDQPLGDHRAIADPGAIV